MDLQRRRIDLRNSKSRERPISEGLDDSVAVMKTWDFHVYSLYNHTFCTRLESQKTGQITRFCNTLNLMGLQLDPGPIPIIDYISPSSRF